MSVAGGLVAIGMLWLLGHGLRGTSGLRLDDENPEFRIGLDFLAGCGLASLLMFLGSLHSTSWGLGLVYLALVLLVTLGIRRRRLFTLPNQPARDRSSLVPILILLLAVFLSDARLGTLAADGMSSWGLKAKMIHHLHRIPVEHLTDLDRFGYILVDYPLQWPLLEVWCYLHMGWRDDEFVRILGAAFSTTLALLLYGTLRSRCSAAVSLAVPIIVLSLHTFMRHTGDGLADTPLLVFSFAGFYSLGCFAHEGRRPALALGGMMLGFAAWTKNEGLAHLMVGTVMVGLILFTRKSWRDSGPSLALFGGMALSPLPWFLFRKAFSVPSHYATGHAPLSDAPRRLGIIFQNLGLCISQVKAWSLLWPLILLGLALAGRRIWRGSPHSRVFTGAAGALFLVYELVHLRSPVDPVWQIPASTPRLMLHLATPLLWSVALYADRGHAEPVDPEPSNPEDPRLGAAGPANP